MGCARGWRSAPSLGGFHYRQFSRVLPWLSSVASLFCGDCSVDRGGRRDAMAGKSETQARLSAFEPVLASRFRRIGSLWLFVVDCFGGSPGHCILSRALGRPRRCLGARTFYRQGSTRSPPRSAPQLWLCYLAFFAFIRSMPSPRRHPSRQGHQEFALFQTHFCQILPQPLEVVHLPPGVSPQLAVM